MNIVELPIELIDEDIDQPRFQFDEEALQELMKSIDEIGLLSPIKVRETGNGRYKIIYGNRRYKASKRLERPTIPCIVSDVTDEMEIYLEQIAENLTREGFSPIEEAEAFDKLLNDARFKSSIKFLSAKLGKPEAYIKNKCELLKFGNAVKKLIVGGTEIRKDKLTEGQLLPLKDLPIEHRDPLALIVARDELPVSDVRKIAKLFKDKTISAGTKDKLLFKTGSGLIETWSTYEQNRAERAKPKEEAAAPKGVAAQATGAQAGDVQTLGAQSASGLTGGMQTADAHSENGNASSGAQTLGAQSASGYAGAPQATDGQTDGIGRQAEGQTHALGKPPVSPIQLALKQLLGALASHEPPAASDLQSLAAIPPYEQAAIVGDVHALIQNLELHLAKWNEVRRSLG